MTTICLSSQPTTNMNIPRISMVRDNGHDRWLIRFDYRMDEDYSFAVEIDHNLTCAENDFRVVAYHHGDRSEVVTRDEFKRRVDEAITHEPCFEDTDKTDEECNEMETRIREKLQTKLTVVEYKSFWQEVDNCIARWNAMLFLFQPTVCL